MTCSAALALVVCLGSANAIADSGRGRDADRDIDKSAEEALRAQERAARDAADAERRASKDRIDAADRAARIEQRFAEERTKALRDQARDPEKTAGDLAKAEADREKSLGELQESNSGKGSSGSGSGSSGSGSDNSGPGSANSGSSNSGSDNSGSGSSHSGSDDSEVATASSDTAKSESASASAGSLRALAPEENPDFDKRGFPVRRGEVVALDLSEDGLASAKSQGFRLISREPLEVLSGTVTRLDIPSGLTPETALAQLRALDANATVDFTHYYGLQLAPQGTAEPGSGAVMHRRPGRLTIGMIDTGVAPHPALSGTAITQRRFGSAPAGAPQVDHGTAVASILASEGSHRLLVADVFRGSASVPFTSADAIAQSLEWMAESGVSVVNISLAGPSNAILDRLIERASARGMIVVAAAGNGGPTAPPAYPAALRPVVAVTAVDAQSRIYRYANQGDYIAVAARGVGEPAAKAGGGILRYSGTSFATPHIAAWVARCLHDNHSSADLCRDRLRLSARDAGAPGRDPVYGWGIIDGN